MAAYPTMLIEGPCGPFAVPAAPENTRDRARFVCEQVWSGAEYALDVLPRDIRSVVDIGAHLGSFAVLALKHWPSLVSLVCYEPNEIAASMTRNNITAAIRALGRDVSAVVHAVAVTSDTAPLFHLPWDWAVARTYGVGAGGDPVAATHPRDLPQADLLKCDGEGIEVDVLEHYAHWASLKALLLELHCPGHKEAVREICEARCFRRLRGEDGPYGPCSWVR